MRKDSRKACVYSGDTIGYSSQYRGYVESAEVAMKGHRYHGEKGRMVVCLGCGRHLKVTQAGYGGSAGAVPWHHDPVRAAEVVASDAARENN